MTFVGYAASVGVSYFGNSLFTFRRSALHGPQFVRFAVISLAGLAVNQATVFVCTDGVWGSLRDSEIATALTMIGIPAQDQLAALCRTAIAAAGPNSDNTSGAVLRWRSQ